MTKHCLIWKPVKRNDVRISERMDGDMPYLISISYRGTLLSEILAMSAGEPVSFERAVGLARDKFMEAFNAHRIGGEHGECNWYFENFVEWISSLGYHIEITGDEFEAVAMTDRLS